ncbi:hypothetical protein GCM10010421_07480 [Streptomyces glaucus]|uniref:Uncharacterized protein n=1 Tax=Streptomyces glaucus TaxID=284029 RepID=A0ABN3J8T5_9ACTN
MSCEALTVAVGGAVPVSVPPVVEQAHREQPATVAATARTALRGRAGGAVISARSAEAPWASRAPRPDGSLLPAGGCAEAEVACGVASGVAVTGTRPAVVRCRGLPVDAAETALGDEGREDGVPEMFG